MRDDTDAVDRAGEIVAPAAMGSRNRSDRPQQGDDHGNNASARVHLAQPSTAMRSVTTATLPIRPEAVRV